MNDELMNGFRYSCKYVSDIHVINKLIKEKEIKSWNFEEILNDLCYYTAQCTICKSGKYLSEQQTNQLRNIV